MSSTNIFYPEESTIGILGSGQLGRMLALSARTLGYQIAVYSPDQATPAGQVADWEIHAEYEDQQQLQKFCEKIDLLTLEFENIPREALDFAERFVSVRPHGEILHVAQHRLREKETLQNMGFPVTPFIKVESPAQLEQAFQTLGGEVILKTAAFGYDGKGQIRIRHDSECLSAWNTLQTDIAVAEKCISFSAECSVLGARNPQGEFQGVGPFRNEHRHHILDVTTYPGDFSAKVSNKALEIVRMIMQKFEMIGLLCVEFFVLDDDVLINEMAPRPHNSGHLTIEALQTSQFEQMIRAVCGLPLGSFELRRPAAMVNLLGDVWEQGRPHWEEVLKCPDMHLHLYGKKDPRAGRKMGHLTALDDSVSQARNKALNAKELLIRR